MRCSRCSGTGIVHEVRMLPVPGTVWETCPGCAGSGFVFAPSGRHDPEATVILDAGEARCRCGRRLLRSRLGSPWRHAHWPKPDTGGLMDRLAAWAKPDADIPRRTGRRPTSPKRHRWTRRPTERLPDPPEPVVSGTIGPPARYDPPDHPWRVRPVR